MNQPQRERQRRGTEFVLFLVASVIGMYGLGQGLTGLFEPGQGISLPWLAVTGVAVIVLFAQMGRVHDTWPRKPEQPSHPHTNEQAARQAPMQAEER
ncbi:MAG TPA: hypothetical protein VGT44_09135 [Ktedonobacteraceae bacterium]|nr:hypothetical protein [Ktedonobacteraceae bacterium]